MDHLFLSPHADDAIGSCGGLMARLVAAGEQVVVITLFGGACPPPYAPCVEGMHRLWGQPHDVARLRHAEDEAATARLGASLIYVSDEHAAIYRRDGAGAWLYPDLQALFGIPHPADEQVRARLVARLAALVATRCDPSGLSRSAEASGRSPSGRNLDSEPQHCLYAPLGAGHHVDHLIVFAVAWQLLESDCRVVFYEDFPYASKKNALDTRLVQLPALTPSPVALDDEDLLAKIEAFNYYRSQIRMLFVDYANMPHEFIAYARSVGGQASRSPFAERFWQLPGREEPLAL